MEDPKLYTVEVICAWCEKPLGTKGGMTRNEPTHGICPKCKREMLGDPVSRRIRESLEKQAEQIRQFQDLVTEFQVMNIELIKLVEGIDELCEEESSDA